MDPLFSFFLKFILFICERATKSHTWLGDWTKIYLEAQGHSCNMWDVLLAAYRIFSCGIWDLVPWPGVEPRPLHWELRVLATGPPGKFPDGFVLNLQYNGRRGRKDCTSHLPWLYLLSSFSATAHSFLSYDVCCHWHSWNSRMGQGDSLLSVADCIFPKMNSILSALLMVRSWGSSIMIWYLSSLPLKLADLRLGWEWY